MINKVDFGLVAKWLLLCGWFVLFIAGLTHYTGLWSTYTVFSIVFLILLLSGFHRQLGYGYLFFVVMLWLGFWLKKTVHMLLGETYSMYGNTEAVGHFVGSGAAWDATLWVAIAAGMGVLFGRMLFIWLVGTTDS